MYVPLHSAIKHQIISYYFGVLKNFCRGESLHSFNYIDLYSGDGKCVLRDEIPQHVSQFLPDNVKTKWNPPFFSLLDFALENGKLRFFFNDYGKQEIEELGKAIAPYFEKVEIHTENKDAEDCVQDAITFIKRPNIPSLFYLDPFNHKNLKFSMIKKISEFTDERTKRKPELIINLMVFSMLTAIERQDYQDINETLGNEEWIKQLELYHNKGLTHELFKDFFIRQLEKLGYHCTWYLVRSIRNNAPQYYLIFATYSEKIYSTHKTMEPNIKKLQEEKWIKLSHHISWLTDHIGEGQKSLNSFI